MSYAVKYLANSASGAEIAKHLLCCDADFVATLSKRVAIPIYAQKIASKATRFEAWSNGTLIGLVAAYCNDLDTRIAHITSVSVMKGWTGKGIATILLNQCVNHIKAVGLQEINLEVAAENLQAIKLYEKSGFSTSKVSGKFLAMKVNFQTDQI